MFILELRSTTTLHLNNENAAAPITTQLEPHAPSLSV